MTSRRAFLRAVSASLSLAVPAVRVRAEDYVRESAYNYIIVTRNQSIITLRRVENGAELSIIDLKEPERQVIPYTRYLFLPAIFNPHPQHVLSIGLGAGAFNRLFNLAFPHSQLTTVEIDPMILDIAREFTGFNESKNNRIEIADGRRFLNRTDLLWDWIVLDAYVRKSQIPPHLTTVEFFRTVRSRLTSDGLFVVNLAGSEEFLRRVSITIEIAFPGSAFWPVGGSGNVVCVSSCQTDYNLRAATVAPPSLEVDLRKFGVDLSYLARAQHRFVVVDANAALTDDFAPTEYLNLE